MHLSTKHKRQWGERLGIQRNLHHDQRQSGRCSTGEVKQYDIGSFVNCLRCLKKTFSSPFVSGTGFYILLWCSGLLGESEGGPPRHVLQGNPALPVCLPFPPSGQTKEWQFLHLMPLQPATNFSFNFRSFTGLRTRWERRTGGASRISSPCRWKNVCRPSTGFNCFHSLIYGVSFPTDEVDRLKDLC